MIFPERAMLESCTFVSNVAGVLNEAVGIDLSDLQRPKAWVEKTKNFAKNLSQPLNNLRIHVYVVPQK